MASATGWWRHALARSIALPVPSARSCDAVPEHLPSTSVPAGHSDPQFRHASRQLCVSAPLLARYIACLRDDEACCRVEPSYLDRLAPPELPSRPPLPHLGFAPPRTSARSRADNHSTTTRQSPDNHREYHAVRTRSTARRCRRDHQARRRVARRRRRRNRQGRQQGDGRDRRRCRGDSALRRGLHRQARIADHRQDRARVAAQQIADPASGGAAAERLRAVAGDPALDARRRLSVL